LIVRLWRSVAKADMSDAYLEYFRATGLRDYRATPGNRSVTVLTRPVTNGVEWLIVTSWESWEAIRAFAGDDPSRARFYPDDARYFVALDERVEHYELLLDER
jgi:heme-degrading monooxygenase HmoA